jgi:hypothetical protein
MAVPNVAVGDILKVRVVMRATDQLAFNIGHFRVSSVAGASRSVAQIATELAGVFGPSYLDVLSANASFVGVGVQRIIPTPPDLEATSVAGAGPGNVAGDLLPPAVACVGKLKTDSAGRRYRGRKYIPFASEASNDANGHPGAGFLGDIAAVMSQWSQGHTVAFGGNSAILTPILFHRDDSSWTDITSNVVNGEWGQMRKRSSLAGADVQVWP